MKQKLHIIGFTVLLLFASCDVLSDTELSEENSGEEYVTWVEQIFSGGRQCKPEESYEPPDTKMLLLSEGIVVFETDIQHLGVCAACSCPYYAAVHYALIPTDELEAAKEIGFEVSDELNQ